MQFLFRSVKRGHESSFIAEEESRPSRANEKERERREKIERERERKREEGEEEKEKGRRRISLERNFKSGGVGKWGRGSWWSVVLGVVPFVERQ